MNVKKWCSTLCGVYEDHRHLDVSLLILRVVVGLAFITHGWGKVSNMEGTVGMFASMDMGVLMAYIASYVEFLGGVAVLLGVATRLAGGLLTIFMVAAIYLVKLDNGYSMMNQGYEYELLLLVCALFITLVGPGKYSLHDRYCKGKH